MGGQKLRDHVENKADRGKKGTFFLSVSGGYRCPGVNRTASDARRKKGRRDIGRTKGGEAGPGGRYEGGELPLDCTEG